MANISKTGSSSQGPLGRSLSEIAWEVALSILTTLTSFLGNFLVVYVVLKDSRLKELDKYIHPKPGIDCHFHGIAAHALLANKLV